MSGVGSVHPCDGSVPAASSLPGLHRLGISSLSFSFITVFFSGLDFRLSRQGPSDASPQGTCRAHAQNLYSIFFFSSGAAEQAKHLLALRKKIPLLYYHPGRCACTVQQWLEPNIPETICSSF